MMQQDYVRFMTEGGTILTTLSMPNVPAVGDMVVHAGYPYVVVKRHWVLGVQVDVVLRMT